MGETGLLDRKRCRVYLRDERDPLVYTMIKGMLVVARKKSDKT